MFNTTYNLGGLYRLTLRVSQSVGTNNENHQVSHLVLSSFPFCAQCFVINFNFVPDNLEEDSKYEARVEARNGFGWSNQSDVFKFFTRTKGKFHKQKLLFRS